MTWQDFFCWIGWHNGEWGKLEKKDFVMRGQVKGESEIPAGSKYFQQYDCPNCKYANRRLVSDETSRTW